MSSVDLLGTSHFAQRFGSSTPGQPATTQPNRNATSSTGSRQRVALQVGYLTSFAHASSNTLIHVFQCAEPHRIAIGVPARRVAFLADERGYDLDFEAVLKRCASISAVCEVAVLPQDASGLVDTGDVHVPLTDADVLLQQSSQLDFIRTIGALFRPTMSGGTPPIFEIDEGQPVAPRINCHRRHTPLRSAIVDGISKEALRVLTEDHARQIRNLQSQISDGRHFHTEETAEFYAGRESLKQEIARLQQELHATQRQLREERDAAKIQLSHALEDVRKARSEVTYMKLIRFQSDPAAATPMAPMAPPPSYPVDQSDPSSNGSAALRKLRDELSSNEQFIAKIRSPQSQQHPSQSREQSASAQPYHRDVFDARRSPIRGSGFVL